MRILSFEQHWPKLNQTLFSTFRFARKDKDWQQGELVKIVVRSRTPERLELGIAKISARTTGRVFPTNSEYPFPHTQLITPAEAITDGFLSVSSMYAYFVMTHGKRLDQESLNKLVLMYTERY